MARHAAADAGGVVHLALAAWDKLRTRAILNGHMQAWCTLLRRTARAEAAGRRGAKTSKKLAHDSLAAVPVWAGEGAAEATGRRVARLRARLLHFVAALRTHVMSRALDGCWHALQSAMERATSLEAMRTAHEAYLTALARQCMIAPDRFWSLVSERVQKALRAAMAFAAAAGTMSDGYVTAGEVARALVAVDKAEEQFNEAIHYLLQVLQAKLKVGSFPALQELRDSIDYNGFERAKGALCEI